MNEHSPKPGDLNSQFGNFIDGLEIDGFTGRKPHEKETDEGLAIVDSNPDFHRIEIGDAKFGANVSRSGEDIGLQINFPVHDTIYSFDYFERTINGIIDSGFMGYIHRPTPYVKITRDRETGVALDLRSAWDFRKYEKEIEKGNFTAISFKMNADEARSPFAKPEDQSTFTYGFIKGTTLKPQSKEYLHFSPKRARETNLNINLYRDILRRHKDYFGRNEDDDLKDLASHVRRIVDEAFPDGQKKESS